MNWYIGQEIVCIREHSKGVVKKGQIYVIQGLQISPCQCKIIYIDVGIIPASELCRCIKCSYIWSDIYIWWLSENLFAPLEYDKQAIEELLRIPEQIKII